MADQDLNINVRTTADTAGIQKTREELEKLRQDAGAAALFAKIPPGGQPKPSPTPKVGEEEILDRAGGRLLTSFVRSIVGLAAIEGIANKLVEWGESIKKAAEEQRKLNREIDRAVRGYEDIRNLDTWDKENAKIEEQIALLRDRKKIATDPDQIQAISKEIDARERQQQDLAILTQRGYQRARAEENVRVAIRDQVDALAEADRLTPASVDAAKAKRAEAEKNYKQVQDTEAAQVSARADAARLAQESADADTVAAKAKKDLADAEKEARRDPGSVDVAAAREKAALAEREAQAVRDQASGAAAYVRELDHGKDALKAQLETSKAILEYERQAAREAVRRAQDELARRVPGLSGQQPVKEADMNIQRVLMNEQASARAHAEGRERDEEMFAKSAEAYRRSLSPQQAQELQHIRDLGKESDNPVLKAINDQTTLMKQLWQ